MINTPSPIILYPKKFNEAVESSSISPSAIARLSRLAPSWSESIVKEAKSIVPAKTASPLLLERPRRQQFSFTRDDHADLMQEIESALETESLLAQATTKYNDLINKEGFSLLAKNAEPQKYLKSRFYYLGRAVKVPFESLIKSLTWHFCAFGSAFLVKSRFSPTQIVKIGGKSLRSATQLHGDPKLGPISGYWSASPLEMEPYFDKDSGEHLGWIQTVSGREPKFFTLEEVVYFSYQPRKLLGVPMVKPVLDDARALRSAEEMVLQLINKYITPLIHHECPATGDDEVTSPEDVNDAANMYSGMAPNGVVVTPHGTVIKVLGVEGAALDAEKYLQYFLRREIMGVGLSPTILGLEDTSAGTSDVLTTQMHDKVKSIQQDIEYLLDFWVIVELLLEGGFNPIDDETQMVNFEFKEIELDTKVKMENHHALQYEQGAITEDEMRHEQKRNPISNTERKGLHVFKNKSTAIKEEVQANVSGEKDLASHNHELEKELIKLQARVSPKGTPQNSKVSGSQRRPKATNRTKYSGASNAARNIDNPSNQHGSRGGPRMSTSPAAGVSSQKNGKN